MPGKDDGIERTSRTNASHLNSKCYAGEEKIIITVRLLRKLFLSLINMEHYKEAITEEETETRSDDIKHRYHVHHQKDW